MAVVQRISRDNLTLVAAGVAFYAMLAIFPAIAAFISVYGVFADPVSVQSQINNLSAFLPNEVLSLLEGAVSSFASKGRTQLNMAALIGFVLALWSAKSGTSSLMTGLNIANDAEEKRSYVMQQVAALSLTLFTVVLAIIALAAVALVPAATRFLYLEGALRIALEWGRWPILAIVIELAFAVIYRFGPCKARPKWRWITMGAAVATLFWLLGSAGFSFYVSHFGGYDKTYGSLAAVVILLLWLWVTALVILIGAEIDAELTTTQGQGARPVRPKDEKPVGRASA
jgi:membrane protein